MQCPHCLYDVDSHQETNYIGISRCSSCHRSYSLYYARGKDFLRLEDYEEAIKYFLIALKHFKNTPQIYVDLAIALDELSKTSSDNNNFSELIKKRDDAMRQAIEIGDELSLETLVDLLKMLKMMPIEFIDFPSQIPYVEIPIPISKKKRDGKRKRGKKKK